MIRAVAITSARGMNRGGVLGTCGGSHLFRLSRPGYSSALFSSDMNDKDERTSNNNGTFSTAGTTSTGVASLRPIHMVGSLRHNNDLGNVNSSWGRTSVRYFTQNVSSSATSSMLNPTCPIVLSRRSLTTTASTTDKTAFSMSHDKDETVFTKGGDGATASNSTMPSFDETMSKLIPNDQLDKTTDAATTTLSVGLPWDPTWYNLADQAINVVNLVHNTTGISYGLSIVAVTCIIRAGLFPLFVKSQQNTSRMTHMKPEMDALKAKIDRMGSSADQAMQIKMANQMKSLFKKYDCNPAKALLLPFIQAPIFMSMFFGLRKMPQYFPDELSTGGMLWFTDLTSPDPHYILPVTSALSFLLMMELGKEQMLASNPQQGKMMLNFFRGLAVVMVPVTLNFSTAIFCYWMTNNVISLGQSVAFRKHSVRKALGIWDPPKPVPGAPEPKGLVESVQDAIKSKAEGGGKGLSDAERIKAHNEAIENEKKAAQIRKAGRNRKRGRAGRKN